MKAQILKISGHKNEKDFYKEFPTMESFMAKHGAKLKKAQTGVDMNINNIPDYLEGVQPTNQYTGAGSTPQEFGSAINQNAAQPNFGPQNAPYTPIAGWQKPGMPQNEPIFDPSSVMQPYQRTDQDDIAQGQAIMGQAQQSMAKSQQKKGGDFKTGVGMIDKVVGGFKALTAEKKALKSARIWRDVSTVARKASETEDVNKDQMIADAAARKRKALMPTVTGEELFPVYGTGTNPLAKHGKGLPTGGLKRSEDYGSKSKPYASVSKGDFAGGGRSYPIPTIQDAGDALRLASLHNRPDVKAKVYAKYPELRKHPHGGEIMNTYAPEDIYQDLGYEPLMESEFGYQPLLTDLEVLSDTKMVVVWVVVVVALISPK